MAASTGGKPSAKPSEAKPGSGVGSSPNADGNVFGVWTAGVRGSNPGAK